MRTALNEEKRYVAQSSETSGEWPWNGVLPDRKAKEMPDWPRISIVTPSYNQGAFIEETIRSVLLQGYPNLEYIIMDGASRDNTIEVIKKYEKYVTCWVSEKDRGQSHAINKGIDRCTGDIFNWLNSDDLLTPGALWEVAKAWRNRPGCIVSGDTEFFNASGVFRCEKAGQQTLHNFVRFWEADRFGWAQQSTFVPLRDLKAVGGVREDLVYCMDYNMMVRLLQRGVDTAYVRSTLARFRFHNESKTVGATEAFRLERVPMLRAMKELSIGVEDWEWDREQAKRLVDVARHALGGGHVFRGVGFLGRAFRHSPSTVIREVWNRTSCRILGSDRTP
jgi:glycosyltransferase involved in cell wall biosynthesis